jgi:hypothetical protein
MDLRVTTVLPLPELSIGCTNAAAVRIAWPNSLAGYILQSALALTNASWVNVPTAPVIEGSEKVVTEPSTGGAKYYRLKK